MAYRRNQYVYFIDELFSIFCQASPSLLKDDDMIKIGIVDDHAIVRSGLKQFFSDQVDLRVVGEAASGREAIDLVRNTELDVLVTSALAYNRDFIAPSLARRKPEGGEVAAQGLAAIEAVPVHPANGHHRRGFGHDHFGARGGEWNRNAKLRHQARDLGSRCNNHGIACVARTGPSIGM